MYRSIVKPLMFLLPPEFAHKLTLVLFKIIMSIPILGGLVKRGFHVSDPKLKRKILGLEFPNPVGLAAGFDKDGRYYDLMSKLGFGFIEIGTVTPKPQIGNPKPRLFRLPKDQALINRMGFNNLGLDAMVERLNNRKTGKFVVGGNIGKNKDTHNDNALEDYRTCFNALFPCVDYFVVNVSSPNTPGLRDLQEKEPLERILNHLMDLNNEKIMPKPILLKIAPDLTKGQLNDIVEIIASTKIDGVIATNTTIKRNGLQTNDDKIDRIGRGGLSGKPLEKRSLEVIKFLRQHGKEGMVIIGVGGINSGETATNMLDAGADLIQLYTGLIYEGPRIVKKINKAILAKTLT